MPLFFNIILKSNSVIQFACQHINVNSIIGRIKIIIIFFQPERKANGPIKSAVMVVFKPVRKQNRPRIYPNGLQPGGLFSEQCDP